MTAPTGHPLSGTLIDADRPCAHCGYNLKGLATGTVCPECGTPIRSTRNRFADNLTDAPLWYVRRLAWGSGLMAASILLLLTLLAALLVTGISTFIASLSGTFTPGRLPTGLALLALGTVVLVPILWPLGMFLIGTARPPIEGMVRDAVLDKPHLRRTVQITGLLVPLVIASATGAVFAKGAIAIGLAVTSGVFLLALLPASVPAAIYLASLADWSGDTNLGGRLRACAWGICVFGLAAVLGSLLSFIPHTIAGLAGFAAFWSVVLVAVCLVVQVISIIQLSNVCRWAVRNSVTRAERDERLAEKRRRQAHEMVARSLGAGTAPSDQHTANEYDPADDPVCAACSYSLGGLPHEGRCPECGTFYELAPGDRIYIPPPPPQDDADDAPIALSAFDEPLGAAEDLPPGYDRLGPERPTDPGEPTAPAASADEPSAPRISHTPKSITAGRRGRREDSADAGRGDKSLDTDGWSV